MVTFVNKLSWKPKLVLKKIPPIEAAELQKTWSLQPFQKTPVNCSYEHQRLCLTIPSSSVIVEYESVHASLVLFE